MLKGRKFYIQYEAYVVFIVDDKAYTRKLMDDNKVNQTGKVRFKNEIVEIKYHY